MAENIINETDCTPLDVKAMEAVNVVLMGESGAGKTTLINALLNCIQFQSFDEAVAHDGIQFAAPVHFNFFDEHTYETKFIFVGKQEDEMSRYACKSYAFSNDKYKIRLIDCPSFDNHENTETVKDTLHFISQYGTIKAIAIVLQSNQARLTSQFQYCIQQIFANLDKSVIENIVFIITHCTNYKPGDVLQPLRAFLDMLKSSKSSAEINLNRNSIYCFENEGFRNLMVVKQGAKIDESEGQRSQMSWSNASAEFQRFLKYVGQLKPQAIDQSLFINKLRIFDETTSNLLEGVTENLQLNQSELKKLQLEKRKAETDMAELKLVQVPKIVDVVFLDSSKQLMICQSEQCRSQVILDDGKVKYYNEKVCCTGCYAYAYPRVFCWQIKLRSGLCKKCGCHVRDHRRQYYSTTATESGVANAQPTNGTDTCTIEQAIDSLTANKIKLESRRELLEQALDTVDRYLAQNAIIARGSRYSQQEEGVSTQPPAKTTPKRDDVIEMMSKVLAMETTTETIPRKCETIFDLIPETEVHLNNGQPWFNCLQTSISTADHS